MDVSRVVPVIRVVAGKRRAGSGYRVAGRWVLTAAHCVTGTGHRVWLADGERTARVAVNGRPRASRRATPATGVDLGLLEIVPDVSRREAPVGELPALACARIDRTTSGRVDGCETVGYPDYMATDAEPFRTAQVDGWIAAASGLVDTASGRRPGFLTLKADGPLPAPLPTAERELGRSMWKGMSGAAVFAGDQLVGVVAEHHLPEGDGSLTVVPIEWVDRLPEPDRSVALRALGLRSMTQAPLIACAAVRAPSANTLLAAKHDDGPCLPVADWNPFQLGIHQPITIGPKAAGTPLPQLPRYVERAHDGKLREHLADPAQSKFVLVTGKSSTGKTRAAYEALCSCLPNWPLWYPLDAATLVRLVDAGLVRPQHVLWLNETQRYLQDPDHGEAAAGAIRRLLTSPGPVVVVGTMWTRDWTALTMRPDQAPDRHAQARELLNAAVRIAVQESFLQDGSAWRRMLEIGQRDPRLAAAAAAAAAGKKVIQVLAGGKFLVDWYNNADNPYGKALITAALDARRLGHQAPIQPDVLCDALPGYLDTAERAAASDDWQGQAFAYARHQEYGIAALVGVRSGPGVGPPDGYLLHDYLLQYARETLNLQRVPGETWDALLTHAVHADDLFRLAVAARRRRLYRYGFMFACSAVVAGSRAATESLARFLPEERLKTIKEMVADPGQPGAQQRQLEEVWRRAAEAGQLDAMVMLGKNIRFRDGDEGERWLRQAAEAGHPTAMVELGQYLFFDDRTEEAERWYRQAADTGLAVAMGELTLLYDVTGRPAEAARWERRAAEAGDLSSLERLTERLKNKSRKVDELIEIWQLAAETGSYGVGRSFVFLLRDLGRQQEAEQALHRLAEAGYPDAMYELGRVLQGADPDESLRWIRRAAEAGDAAAMLVVGINLRKQGHDESAIHWERRALDTGQDAAFIYATVPDADEEETLRNALQSPTAEEDEGAGRMYTLWQLGRLLEMNGRAAEAEPYYRQAVEVGFRPATVFLAGLLEKTSRVGEARRLADFGIEPGGRTADPWPK